MGDSRHTSNTTSEVRKNPQKIIGLTYCTKKLIHDAFFIKTCMWVDGRACPALLEPSFALNLVIGQTLISRVMFLEQNHISQLNIFSCSPIYLSLVSLSPSAPPRGWKEVLSACFWSIHTMSFQKMIFKIHLIPTFYQIMILKILKKSIKFPPFPKYDI